MGFVDQQAANSRAWTNPTEDGQAINIADRRKEIAIYATLQIPGATV
jgi:hypothetical protein